MTPAFLLTRQWSDDKDGVRLDFWLTAAQGPLMVSIHQQQALFFIRQDDAQMADTLIGKLRGVSIKPLQLKTFDEQPVSGVYFDSQQQLYRSRDRFVQNGIACYEADIRPTERFLCERFITASVDINADYSKEGLQNVRLQPGEYTPSFEVMSLDIESDYETDLLFSIAFVTASTNRVLMIGDGVDSDLIEYVADEASLLSRWIEWVERIDPDILIGWNVINFDLRLLQKKSQALGVPLSIGRGASQPVWRQSQADRNHHFVLIPGRVVLDGIDTLRSATYNFASFALESVARELLGRGKLIHDKTHSDPFYKAKEIRRQFEQEKETLAAYNLEDCQLVWDIFEKTELVRFSIERARLTGLEIDRTGGSVAAFDNLYLPRLHRKGYIAPNIGDYQGELSAPGGYVMDSTPGLQDSVLVLDYKSLYPSIIRTFRVDPLARVAAQRADPQDVIPGYDGASFHKRDHILPKIIENLWAARDEAKRDGNAALSQAIKIIMNSFYGVLGTSGCRLHDSRLTSSITKRGHDIIIQTVKLIEAEGYEVIYGDTDSVFVSLNGSRDNRTAADIGNHLVATINRYWRDYLQQEYAIESCLEMEFETHFRQFFMPTMRGSEQGSKKRYAGLIDDEQGKRNIVYKGLETVRTDWTELAREFQQTLYQLIFDGEEYADYIRQTVADLYDGRFDHQLVYRKRLHKKLAEYQKNIPPHAQAAIKAEAEFKQNQQPSRYRNRSWIEYVITVAGAQTLECQNAKLDYEHIVEKQLTPIADTILNAIGSSMDEIARQQQSLF
ncbi:MAG: DNA polymerase II [Gammaproteobacteria bacterium]|nr:DNA polymerase II [Gammaproteobacteria bacterium]